MSFLVATTSLPAVYRPNNDARTTTPNDDARTTTPEQYVWPFQHACSRRNLALKFIHIHNEQTQVYRMVWGNHWNLQFLPYFWPRFWCLKILLDRDFHLRLHQEKYILADKSRQPGTSTEWTHSARPRQSGATLGDHHKILGGTGAPALSIVQRNHIAWWSFPTVWILGCNDRLLCFRTRRNHGN